MENRRAQDISIPGGIVHNPAAPYAREMAKWEMGYSPYGPPGRPREEVGYQQWPALFYKCKRRETNGDFVVEHYTEADGPTQADLLYAQGYRLGRAAAEAHVAELEQVIAVAAAERAAQDRHMSVKARAEAQRVDDSTSEHVGVIPETPIKRRGRPVKIKESV